MSDGAIVLDPAPGPAAEVNGLHSPPDSNTKDASDSELSDLDDQEPPPFNAHDIGEIEPSYYSKDGVPVFEPTMDEFRDFTLYMDKINKYGMKTGIVKVIPPAEWKAAQPRLDEAVKRIKVKEPIKQDMMGTSGTYRQANMIHQRSYNLPQWRQLCDQSDHQPPARRGERRANQDRPARAAPRPRATGTPSAASHKKGKGKQSAKGKARGTTVEKEDESKGTPDRLPTPVSPSMKTEEDGQSIKLELDDNDEGKPRLGSRQPKAISVSSRRKNNRREMAAKVDEAAFKDFKYDLNVDEYTPERCEELERGYWKTLTYAPPLYGADMPGTLFDDRTTSWNLGKLDNILDVLGAKIPGVNTAYLYLGMWKATFAWHLEDVDLYSINYLHFGAPKQWYSISQGDARRFEAAMRSIWPADAKSCDQFLRHKTFLISPSYLMQNFNIKVNKIVHNPGEFVITFPYGYHSGYNLGYNCAEAVNFALDSWVEYGRVAKKCECALAQDSVWIDVHDLERKLRGEETEFEVTDDEEEDEEDGEPTTNLPTPPGSIGDAKTKALQKKRKRPINDKGTNRNTKKIRVRIKVPAEEPCILCPNDIPSEPLLPTENGNGEKAHRICAQYIPETSIDDETIRDIKYIAKGRLDLKCNYCRSKKGACFQCSRKKCTRAYHATCAAAAGVFVEQGDIPVFGEDGTEYKDWGIEFSCRFHRVKRDKKLDSDALSDSERLRKAGLELNIGDVCQVQYHRGDIFAGAVVENRKDEEMILIHILPRGDLVEVEYKWLLLPDAADYHLPKPSANAIPLPKSRKDKESLNTTKRQIDDIPRAEDPFVEGHTWAEFKSEGIPTNPAQAKIDFQKENQIWFYLGKTSTEARAQFTEDPRKQIYNPKGNFLDTIPKPIAATARQSYAASYPSNAKPNTSNAPQGPSRPILPPTTAPAKSEKPYAYKPRSSEEAYRIDPQAYRSQQNFLQRSTPYSFGTDPRWKPADSPASNPYPNHAASTSGVSASRSLAPPAQHRPSSQHAASPKPSNPFGSKTQSSRPNPFAKYPYLQKEHNRSPLEYKSPYRPGGGFMNGYQGSLEKHLQRTFFQDHPGGGSAAPKPPISAYSNNTRVPYNGNQQTTNSAHTPAHHSSYGSYGTTPGAKHQTSQTPPAALTPPNGWGKKDTSQLHPAIRQEYHNPMFHTQYHPPPRPSSSQNRSSVLQPPPLYDRPTYQPPHQNQQYASHNSPATPSHQRPPQNYNRHSSIPSHSASHPQHYSNPASTHSLPPPQQPVQQLPNIGSTVQQPTHQPISHSQLQAPQSAGDLKQKPTQLHQQWPPKPDVPRQAVLPQLTGTHKYEPADVPIDSSSIIEKMMANLRKAKAAETAGPQA